MVDQVETKSSYLVKKHHEKSKGCSSRPRFRDPRWDKAVKVYTINLESKNILVQGVPSLGVSKELIDVFSSYGNIESYKKLDEYPTEEFTEVYLMKYKRINNARYAKRRMDNKSFFGGILHVCYAPEFESVDETREKLEERQKVIAKKARELPENRSEPQTVSSQHPPFDDASNNISHDRSTDCSSDPCSNSTFTRAAEITSNMYTTNQTAFGDHGILSMKCSEFPPIPPPLTLHLSQYPPAPPPSELPQVPSANATLPYELQKMPKITEKPLDQLSNQFFSTTGQQPHQVNTASVTPVHGVLPARKYPLCKPYHGHIPKLPQALFSGPSTQTSPVEFSRYGCNTPGVSRDSEQSTEASVERTVQSIREKLKRVSSDSTPTSREHTKQRNKNNQSQSKRQRKRI